MSAANAAVPDEGSAFNSSTSTNEHPRAHDAGGRGLFGKYLLVLGVLAGFLTVLFAIVNDAPGASQSVQEPRALIEPVVALAGLHRRCLAVDGAVSKPRLDPWTGVRAVLSDVHRRRAGGMGRTAYPGIHEPARAAGPVLRGVFD